MNSDTDGWAMCIAAAAAVKDLRRAAARNTRSWTSVIGTSYAPAGRGWVSRAAITATPRAEQRVGWSGREKQCPSRLSSSLPTHCCIEGEGMTDKDYSA